MCTPSQNDDESTPYKPPRYATKFAKSVLAGDPNELRAFVEAMVFEEDNPEVVKARLNQFMTMMDQYLSEL